MLKSLLFGVTGFSISPTHRGGKLYRYYVSESVMKECSGSLVPSVGFPQP